MWNIPLLRARLITMKVGDLVRPIKNALLGAPLVEEDWKGIIIDWKGADPIVFWNEKFPAEVEYREQVEVISEAGR
jgi:hypothetical protein